MKKRNLIVTMMLTLALVASTAVVAFAGSFNYSFVASGDTTTPKMESAERNQAASQENIIYDIAIQFNKEVAQGKYNLVSGKDLKAWMDAKKDLLIVDTMGAKNVANIAIPGAIATWAPLSSQKWTDTGYNKTEFLNTVKAAAKHKEFYNSKTKKWVKKQPKKSQWKGKKVRYTDTVVVYCGYTGCGRSHQGAMALKKAGFTNVYRYGGGISEWVDLGYPTTGAYGVNQ